MKRQRKLFFNQTKLKKKYNRLFVECVERVSYLLSEIFLPLHVNAWIKLSKYMKRTLLVVTSVLTQTG